MKGQIKRALKVVYISKKNYSNQDPSNVVDLVRDKNERQWQRIFEQRAESH
jgi:hypothetical protein